MFFRIKVNDYKNNYIRKNKNYPGLSIADADRDGEVNNSGIGIENRDKIENLSINIADTDKNRGIKNSGISIIDTDRAKNSKISIANTDRVEHPNTGTINAHRTEDLDTE